MSGPRQLSNLALIGFMGTGKSSVGQVVAAQLGFEFLDTDEAIEKMAGRRISEIFASDGEPAFRAYEQQLVAQLAERRGLVVSTGGGLAANDANLASLRQHALLICLWASPEVVWQRVRHQSHRPLLQTPDPLARIRELLAAREPFYRQADGMINTERRSVKDVAQHVLNQFRLARAARVG